MILLLVHLTVKQPTMQRKLSRASALVASLETVAPREQLYPGEMAKPEGPLLGLLTCNVRGPDGSVMLNLLCPRVSGNSARPASVPLQYWQ